MEKLCKVRLLQFLDQLFKSQRFYVKLKNLHKNKLLEPKPKMQSVCSNVKTQFFPFSNQIHLLIKYTAKTLLNNLDRLVGICSRLRLSEFGLDTTRHLSRSTSEWWGLWKEEKCRIGPPTDSMVGIHFSRSTHWQP